MEKTADGESGTEESNLSRLSAERPSFHIDRLVFLVGAQRGASRLASRLGRIGQSRPAGVSRDAFRKTGIAPRPHFL